MHVEEAVQLERMNIEKLRMETERKLENESIEMCLGKSKSEICLCKLELKKFDRELLRWQEFWKDLNLPYTTVKFC